MLLTKEVEIKWNSRIRSHFVELGYEFTSWKDTITVPIEHLYQSCQAKVAVRCDYCLEVITKVYRDYLVQLNNSPIKKDCCGKCRGLKQIEVCQEKYGVNAVSQVKEIREKQVQGTILKYGVDNVSKNKEIKNKKKETFLKNYGVDHYFKTEECKQKIKESSMDKYGVEHHLQLPEIYQKQIDTNLLKYGVENVFQNEEIKEKSKQTLLENYGVEHAMQSTEIKEKARINANLAMYKNDTAPCSRQQKYLHRILGGELNYPLKTILLDIAFPEEMIVIEFDGSGHNLSVICGNITQQEFNIKESKRNYALLNQGWKIIRIVSLKDLLPSDEMIVYMYDLALNHFNKGNSWIEYNIDENVTRSSIFEKEFIYGQLRQIKEKDLENYTKLTS